ncbi:MarR family transcriptional regulator [Kribbella sp. NPDC056861]|uniref:MarR family winged helix-turn-helix transcriptional regulator n=1 Tax=Kribbella sp. NPDC056861 TaxID=3154857 RepID=UPI00341DB7B0
MSNPELAESMNTAMRTFMAHAVMFQDTVARSVGVRSTDLQCANLLVMHGPLSPGQLAELAGLTAGGGITDALDRLEAAGMVTRSRDTSDRRKVIVAANSDELWRRLGPIYAGVQQQWEAKLAAMDDDQLRFAIELFSTATEINKAETERLRGAGGR